MLAALIITLRETLESALVAGIALVYLEKTGNKKQEKWVWLAVGVGVLCSFLLAVIFEKYLGGFEGVAEYLYEGVLMLIAAALLTWMIFWMLGQKKGLTKKLEKKIQVHVENEHPWGIFSLVFVSVLREGVETVIFLKAAFLQSDQDGMLLGAMGGVVIAVLLAVLFFKSLYKVSLKKFFAITSFMLILFGTGLFAHAIHEFQESGLLPIFVEHVWDVNSVLDEDGFVGSLAKGMFGYNGNPSLLEVVGYWLYLLVVWGVWQSKAE